MYSAGLMLAVEGVWTGFGMISILREAGEGVLAAYIAVESVATGLWVMAGLPIHS